MQQMHQKSFRLQRNFLEEEKFQKRNFDDLKEILKRQFWKK